MKRAGKTFVLAAVVLAAALPVACGRADAGGAANAAETFYGAVNRTGEGLPADLFANPEAHQAAVKARLARQQAYGEEQSRRRTGSQVSVSMDGGGRRETVTLIYDVTFADGRTRETLVLVRQAPTDPFLVASWTVESAGWADPTPPGTSSA